MSMENHSWARVGLCGLGRRDGGRRRQSSLMAFDVDGREAVTTDAWWFATPTPELGAVLGWQLTARCNGLPTNRDPPRRLVLATPGQCLPSQPSPRSFNSSGTQVVPPTNWVGLPAPTNARAEVLSCV